MIQSVSTILYVKDVQQSINFYKNVFGFTIQSITPKKNYVELILGNITISFASLALANYNLDTKFMESKKEVIPFGITLAFKVQKASYIMEKAKCEGAVELHPLVMKPWKQFVGYIRDPNGFLIEIIEENHTI